MEYFIVTLTYRLIDVEGPPTYKDFIVTTSDKITFYEFFHSSKYQIEGYQVVGVSTPAAIPKTVAESLLAYQKATPPLPIYGQ